MQGQYSVQIDSNGYLWIPSEVRLALGIAPNSIVTMTQDGESLRLAPQKTVSERRIRSVPREELAQALIDGADTPEGIADAELGVRELGLDPKDFLPRF